MFGNKKPKKTRLTGQTAEEIVHHVEEQVRQEMIRKAVKVGLFGSITVDPNEVYVSKEQARYSMEVLRKLREEQQAEKNVWAKKNRTV